MVNIKTQQLYSATQGAKPSAELVEVGQLWINLADKVLGTKDQDGNIIAFAQLTEEEKETLLSGGGVYVPKQGVAAEVSVGIQAANASGNITIDDNCDIAISAALTASGLTVAANKTTAHKAVKLVITKAADVTGTITWTGIDEWLNTGSTPVFGESTEAQELCLAIFASPTRVVANVVYNTENPLEIDTTGVDWGNISGILSEQEDLMTALDAKANKTDLPDTSVLATKAELADYATAKDLEQVSNTANATFAPKANAALTGTATLNGQNIATVNQIPDVSDFVTTSTLAKYATTEIVEAEFSSYDKTIKAHIESELGNYVTTTEYGTDKETFLTKTEASSTYATQATVANKADSSALANYAPLTGAAFTGTVTVQEPTAANNPATKQYVDSAVSSVLKYKGTVANESALPQSGQAVGDVWTTQNSNKEFAWDGTKWIELGPTIDLSGYLTTESASATYLSKTDAQSTYQPVGDYATNTALTQGLAGKADTATLANYLPIAGGTITGNLTVSGTLTGTLTGSATKATQDAAGNVITTTYATKAELANKADMSALSAYAPLANPAFTGTATLGGQTIATVNQIPDVSNYIVNTPEEDLGTSVSTGFSINHAKNRFSLVANNASAIRAYDAGVQIFGPGFNLNASDITLDSSDNGRGYILEISDASGFTFKYLDTSIFHISSDSAYVGNYSGVIYNDLTKPMIVATGSRGSLAGYEDIKTVVGSISQDSPDSLQVTAAVQITVNNGSANTAWVKKVSIKNAGVTISLGSAWTWVGGSQPTVTAPSLLVLSWDNDCGMAILNTTG